jgi:hypothetical protein
LTHISVSEQRYLDGKGERFLSNGEIRCQGVSKTKLRLARLEQGNPKLTSDDVWPNCQCPKAAVEGTYLCGFHGGKTPSIKKRAMWEYMPIALQEKYLALQDTSELMNLSRELNELDARKAELYESLEELVLGEEGYQTVYEAKKAIDSGDVVRAGFLLQTVLMNPRSETSIHNEIKEVIKLKEKVTNTYFGMLKDMKEMATTDQVSSMKEEFFNVVKIAIERNIKDPTLISSIYNSIFELMSGKKIDVKALKNAG